VTDLIATIKVSKVPIVCIANDKYEQKLKALKNHCLELDFRWGRAAARAGGGGRCRPRSATGPRAQPFLSACAPPTPVAPRHCPRARRRPDAKAIAARLAAVARNEGMQVNDAALTELAAQANQDIRLVLGQLQMWRLSRSVVK
jgi:replication factor C subunit 1